MCSENNSKDKIIIFFSTSDKKKILQQDNNIPVLTKILTQNVFLTELLLSIFFTRINEYIPLIQFH